MKKKRSWNSDVNGATSLLCAAISPHIPGDITGPLTLLRREKAPSKTKSMTLVTFATCHILMHCCILADHPWADCDTLPGFIPWMCTWRIASSGVFQTGSRFAGIRTSFYSAIKWRDVDPWRFRHCAPGQTRCGMRMAPLSNRHGPWAFTYLWETDSVKAERLVSWHIRSRFSE